MVSLTGCETKRSCTALHSLQGIGKPHNYVTIANLLANETSEISIGSSNRDIAILADLQTRIRNS
jgi:hypothetical protein